MKRNLLLKAGVVMSSESSSTENGKVVNITEFRQKKKVTEELSRGRNPLFVSHMDGKVAGSPHFKKPDAADFGDRIQRVRASLEKINRLMAELKKLSQDQSLEAAKGSSTKELN